MWIRKVHKLHENIYNVFFSVPNVLTKVADQSSPATIRPKTIKTKLEVIMFNEASHLKL